MLRSMPYRDGKGKGEVQQRGTLVHFHSTTFPHAPKREVFENKFAMFETKYLISVVYRVLS